MVYRIPRNSSSDRTKVRQSRNRKFIVSKKSITRVVEFICHKDKSIPNEHDASALDLNPLLSLPLNSR